MKALIFDCFGVLAESGWQTIERELTPSPEQWAELMDVSHQCDLGLISVDDLKLAFASELNTTLEQIRQILDEQNINLDILNMIEDLKPTHKIAMLSNVGRGYIQTIFTADQLSLFDQLILSGEEGIAKPDPRSFLLAAKRLDVEPVECLFIDDAPLNVSVAQELGMTSHVYSDISNLRQFLADSNVQLAG